MWQTKYASAVPKNLRVGVNFRAVKSETLAETIESGPLCITDLFQNKISL